MRRIQDEKRGRRGYIRAKGLLALVDRSVQLRPPFKDEEVVVHKASGSTIGAAKGELHASPGLARSLLCLEWLVMF